MYRIPSITDDVMKTGTGVAELLPTDDDLPTEIADGSSPWVVLAEQWVRTGKLELVRWSPKPNTDTRPAVRMVAATLHAEAPVAVKAKSIAFFLTSVHADVHDRDGISLINSGVAIEPLAIQ